MNITVNNARILALALAQAMPTDPARKAYWIHAVHSLREMLGDEIPIIDKDRWEHLCYEELQDLSQNQGYI